MSALTPIRFFALLTLLEVALAVWASFQGRTFLIGDCPYYAATAESLLRDGDWDLRNQLPGDLKTHEGFFALSKDERVVPKHSVLLPILSLPFFWLLGTKGFLLFNIAQTFLLVCGIMKLAGGGVAARWLALVGYLTTPFLVFTYNYSPDVLGTALVVWSFHFALRERPALAGLLAGLAVWAKIYLVFVLAPLALLILPMGWRKTVQCAVAAMIAIAPMLWINTHLFGAPWVMGYDRDARITATGFAITEHYSRFNQPLLQGLMNLLFDPDLGMLRTAPLWFLWPLGVWFALRADRSRAGLLRTLALTSSLLINLVFFARYDEWNASSYGNRFLFPALAIGLALQGSLWEKVFVRNRDQVAHSSRTD